MHWNNSLIEWACCWNVYAVHANIKCILVPLQSARVGTGRKSLLNGDEEEIKNELSVPLSKRSGTAFREERKKKAFRTLIFQFYYLIFLSQQLKSVKSTQSMIYWWSADLDDSRDRETDRKGEYVANNCKAKKMMSPCRVFLYEHESPSVSTKTYSQKSKGMVKWR